MYDAVFAAAALGLGAGLWLGLAVSKASARIDAQIERDMLRLARAVEVVE